MQIIKKIEDFEIKNKILFFCLTVLLTIAITRVLVFIKDPNIFLFGYELHHFHYGVILLLLTNLFMLFGHKNYKIWLVLTGVGSGLILDEFLFILGHLDNSQYFNTLPSAILFFMIVLCLVVFIKICGNRKNERTKSKK